MGRGFELRKCVFSASAEITERETAEISVVDHKPLLMLVCAAELYDSSLLGCRFLLKCLLSKT